MHGRAVTHNHPDRPAHGERAGDGDGRDRVARDDRTRADEERAARTRLLALGASDLDRRPWEPPGTPPSAVDLLRHHLWSTGQDGGTARDDVDAARAALALLPAARAELEQLETALLFTARAAGLTWAQTAEALGMNSAQACQQRFERLLARRGPASDRAGR